MRKLQKNTFVYRLPFMFRRFIHFVFIWPIERSISLVRGVGRNGRIFGRALKRGATTNPKRNAPVGPGMTSAEIAELDKWWATLSQEERDAVWEAHDAELRATALEAERQGKGTWSLTTNEAKRQSALGKQSLSYFIWMSVFLGFTGAFVVVLFMGNASLMFVLMSICFLAFIFPQVSGLRVTRAQLLYGRKITMREFFRPLPREMHRAGTDDSNATEGQA